MDEYEYKHPKAIQTLRDELESSLQLYHFESIDHRKISSTNVLERLNREIRRRTNVVGIFPSTDSYIRLVTIYMMEYSEDWSTSRCYIDSKILKEIEEKRQPAA